MILLSYIENNIIFVYMIKPNKKPEKNQLEKLTNAELIALVASQIKGKILFPRLMESGQKILDRAIWVK